MRTSRLARIGLAGIILVAAAGAVRAAAPASAEWPQWRGPNRDGKSPDTGLLKEWPAGGPRRLWKVDDIGSGFSSVAVVGGRLYLRYDDNLYCFDVKAQ